MCFHGRQQTNCGDYVDIYRNPLDSATKVFYNKIQAKQKKIKLNQKSEKTNREIVLWFLDSLQKQYKNNKYFGEYFANSFAKRIKNNVKGVNMKKKS